VQDETLTDGELLLIDALQVWPRAPWAKLGPVLGADPVTLARRWSGLADRGLVWVTLQPLLPGTQGGVLEVECHGGSVEEVVAALVQDPECLSIDVTSGGRDLLLTIACSTAPAFSRYVIERVNTLEGVRTVRAQPVVRLIAAATQWRLRTLDGAQARAIEAARDEAAPLRRAAGRSASVDRAMWRLLSEDGRVSTRDVARALDLPIRRARDRLTTALAMEGPSLRIDMPRWASGWPVAAWYFVRVPAAHVSEVRTRLRSLRAVRTVLAVAGPANVLINVWLRELADVEQLEEVMERQLPGVRVLDRSLVLTVRKRMGRVFDADEKPLDVVPWTGE
jgi:DNA-binding Lrp family transcriptional regulator